MRDAIRKVAESGPYLSHTPPVLNFDGMYADGYKLTAGSEAKTVLDTCHRSVYGGALEEHVTTALTDARFTGLYADIPSLVYRPVCLRPHGYDEAVDLESLREVTCTYTLFIAQWCDLEG